MRFPMKFIVFLVYFLLPSIACAQSAAGEHASIESRYIVTLPTAGVLPQSTFAMDAFIFADGGVMLEWQITPLQNLNLGLSFGGNNIIGNNTIIWQSLPGFHLRFRIIDESLTMPAILIGVSTQGRGLFDDSNDHFQMPSPGIFAVASKHFLWLGSIDTHVGLNYSFEPTPANRSINIYGGIEKSLGNIFSLVLEYNATLGELANPFLASRGLLHAALRASLGRGLTLEIQLQDLLQNFRNTDNPTRSVALEYIGTF